MKKLLTMFVCLFIAAVAFGQWEVVKDPVDYKSPTDAVALDATTILQINGNVVTKTADFGATWNDILLPEGVSIADMYALNTTVAFACGDDGLVYKTDDAGDTWTQIADTSLYVVDLKEIAADEVFLKPELLKQ